MHKSNQKFSLEISNLNKNLADINSYFKQVQGIEDKAIFSSNDIKKTKERIFADTKLTKKEEKIANQIAKSNIILDDIKKTTAKRIKDIEKNLEIAGIKLIDNQIFLTKHSENNPKNLPNKEVSLNNKGELLTSQGGPFTEFKDTINLVARDAIFNFENDTTSAVSNNISHLANLEKFINFAPLKAPIEEYYVSSGFGKRLDPIKDQFARHNGIDLVGKYWAKIISPSPGRITFAGQFGAYGNSVVIDHGYGITTRYGHLKNIKVQKGDLVESGQIIGTQGSSGRTTGQHLHYEIRYKNLPLNPKNFLKAGSEIFKQQLN